MTDAPGAARALFIRYQRAMLEWDADALAELYAPQAVHEFPLFSPLFPQRLEGREAIRSHYRRVWSASPIRIVDMREVAVHETLDPQVLIGEAAYTAEASEAGKRFDLSFLVVMRVEDGLIVRLRDYMDALGAAVALERLPQMVEGIMRRRGGAP